MNSSDLSETLEKNANMQLIFDDSAPSYRERLPEILESASKLSKKLGIHLDLLEIKSIKDRQENSLLIDSIRSILPQERGSIVSSRGHILPLSKTKKLNTGNTPILIVKKGSRAIYVFPCLVGERYMDLESGLRHIEASWPRLDPLKVQNEEDAIINQISERPALLEPGLCLVGVEVDTGAGFADAIFKDQGGNFLVIEAEREATDSSIGQILRLAAAFEGKRGRRLQNRRKIETDELLAQNETKKGKRAEEGVRAGIVCFRAHEFVISAAKRAGIEVWTLDQYHPFHLSKRI